jgi:hypothetical protein
MWLFIAGVMLGGIVGIGFMCLLQINRHSEIMEQFEKEK